MLSMSMLLLLVSFLKLIATEMKSPKAGFIYYSANSMESSNMPSCFSAYTKGCAGILYKTFYFQKIVMDKCM